MAYMAYPLRSMMAETICDALLQFFFAFSVPKIISSDCGANLKVSWIQEMLGRVGCSPRFSSPEVQGLTQRCNQSIKPFCKFSCSHILTVA
jgi:hypothetical protein